MGRTCESKKRINPPNPSLMGNENLLLYRRQGPDGGSHNHTGCGLSKLLRAQPGILHCHMRRGQGKLHKPTCSAHITQRQKLAKGSVVHLASNLAGVRGGIKVADAANPRLPLNERVPEGFFANAYRAENSYACDYNPSFHGSHASLSRGRERPCGRKPPAPLYILVYVRRSRNA